MIAVDTNVLARALVDEGSEQSRQATNCLPGEEIFVPDTVLLETEWVLRSRLAVGRPVVAALFSALVVQPNIRFADRARVMGAIAAFREGLDFADAMHLAASGACAAMLTFDAKFIRSAARFASHPAVRLP